MTVSHSVKDRSSASLGERGRIELIGLIGLFGRESWSGRIGTKQLQGSVTVKSRKFRIRNRNPEEMVAQWIEKMRRIWRL